VKRLYDGLVLLLALAMPAQAAVMISDAWFRSLPGKLPAGGYFTARNTGPAPVDITGADSGGCSMLMMHRSSSGGGMSSMAMVDKVTVPAGGEVRFAPAGYHLMCDDPKMKIGGKVPVSLHLSDGTAVVVAFQVRNAAGK
jgi:copper(I)-binding protein